MAGERNDHDYRLRRQRRARLQSRPARNCGSAPYRGRPDHTRMAFGQATSGNGKPTLGERVTHVTHCDAFSIEGPTVTKKQNRPLYRQVRHSASHPPKNPMESTMAVTHFFGRSKVGHSPEPLPRC